GKTRSTGLDAVPVPRTLMFSAAVTVLLSTVSCGRNPSRYVLRPPPGVTEHLPSREAGFMYAIDVVGPVNSPLGKTVSAFVTRALKVSGWAVDSPSKQAASNVDVVIDGVPYAATYGLPRVDVASQFKVKSYRKSGYEFSMPAGGLRKGTHTLCIRVVASDG